MERYGMKIFRCAAAVSAFLFCLLSEVSMEAEDSSRPKLKTVVIDPGHGGKDPGAIGRFSREKNINLSVAKAFVINAGADGNV